MKLFTYFRSSAAFRVRIALNLKRLPYDAVSVDIRAGEQQHRKPAFLAVNPQGLVPALQDKDETIGQSMAILEYLE